MLKDNWEDKHGTHVHNVMLHPLQRFSDNQPFDNHQNHPSQNFIQNTNPHQNESSDKTGISSYNMVKNTQVDLTCKPTEAEKSLSSMEACTTDAEKPIVDSNMQELIKFLSANYGPMKTPLEMGTPEYLRLVEILQQSGSYSKTPSVITDKSEISRNDEEKTDSVIGQPKSDEKKLISEKLWEGSLQLSSSVTLSAITFFKSGEKLVGNNWPKSIEVKGKVRLEAFEKYVKDLPRSRNRGLMVISVCWNEGSSNTGLTGMKEVAKGYKKSSRVGFAQLLSGIDLYICPRSNPIITILAKYGFFKGMSVLDDNHDSMIGCVVWRKNRPPNPITKNSPNSPPTSSIKQPLTLPLTSNSESNKNMALPVTDNLVKKRGFQDDDDDLPEFDFGARLAEKKSSKKTKLFDDDDMPEWCPPPQKPTPNFHNLPLCPPRPPPLPHIPLPPQVDTRPLFSYRPFRPPVSSPPPAFMAAPPLPPPPPPPPLPPPPPHPQPGRFSCNQVLWGPSFPHSNTRHP